MKVHGALLILLALLGLGLDARAQRVEWERRFNWAGTDLLKDVESLGDGTFISCGWRESHQYDDGSGLKPAVCLMRFDENGDTLYTNDCGLYGEIMQLCRFRSGELYLLLQTKAFLQSNVLWLARINPDNGTLLWQRRLNAFRYTFGIKHVIEGPSGSLIAVGQGPDSSTASGNFIYASRIDTSGIVLWSKVLQQHPSANYAGHVEPTERGTYLFSGSAGARIMAFELDSNGTEVRRGIFHIDSQAQIYNERPFIKQGPDDTYLVGAITGSGKMYLALHEGWMGPKTWGGERKGTTYFSQVNDDGTFAILSSVQISGTTWVYEFCRLLADSSVEWRFNFQNRIVNNGSAGLAASVSLADSSLIGVGSFGIVGQNDIEFYSTRIRNVGIPFDPANPVANELVAKLEVKLYPNPCTTLLRFVDLSTPASLELYGMDGKRHLTQTVHSKESIDVSQLPRGLYLYRLSGQGKVFSGRVVKE